MYKIRVEILDYSSHRTCITPSLARLLYHIDTMVAFDFGEWIFEQVVKHVESYVVKLSTGFSLLNYGILSGHKKDLITREDEDFVTTG